MRTAENILKARQNPKKHASKEAKNMLNSLSGSLKMKALDAAKTPMNSFSPYKLGSPTLGSSVDFGTPDNKFMSAAPIMGQDNGLNQVLAGFLK